MPYDKNNTLLQVDDFVTVTFQVKGIAPMDGCTVNVSLQAVGGQPEDVRPVLVCNARLCEKHIQTAEVAAQVAIQEVVHGA